jgi:hypothetical protein
MMTKYQIAVKTSGVDLGVYDGADEDEAVEAMARDAGYRDYAAMCSIADPEDLEAEIERQRSDLIVVKVA